MPTLDEVLGKIQPEDTSEVDFDNYKDAQEFPPPPPRGEYTLIQGKPDFDVSGDGKSLVATMHHKITGGEYDGRQIMYDRVSTKTFDRDGARASTAADHLRALGSSARPRDPREWGEAIGAGEDKPWKAVIDWRASCGDCFKKFQESDGGQITKEHRKRCEVSGERNFPPNPTSGGRLSSVPCPSCGQSLEARANIVRRVPA